MDSTPRSKKSYGVLAVFVLIFLCGLGFMIMKYRQQKQEEEDAAAIELIKKEINEYIYGLDYSRDEVLAYRGGKKYNKPVLIEGKLDPQNNFIVITRKKRSASHWDSNIAVVSVNEHITYPGSLLLANERLLDNAPDVLAIDRAPLTYTINLPGLTEGGSFTIVPSFANYQSAKEKVTNFWFKNNTNNDSVIANFQSEFSFAYSKELVRVKLGLAFANSDVEMNVDFSYMESVEKLIVIYKFTQVFYTVSVEPVKKPSDLFGVTLRGELMNQTNITDLFESGATVRELISKTNNSDVLGLLRLTVDELKNKTDNRNPPVLVDSVSYGRVIYVKIETSTTTEEAKVLLDADLKQYFTSGKFESEIESKLQNLNFQVFVLGGSTNQMDVITAASLQEVSAIIAKNRNFAKNNLGYPIASSTSFVKDNSRATVLMATDYYETSRTVQNKGYIKIVQDGAILAQWRITWDLVAYDDDGRKRVVDEYRWSGNDIGRFGWFTMEFEIPGNAENIHVFGEVWLLFGGWRTVLDRHNVPLIDHRRFLITGSDEYEIDPPT